MEITFGSNCGTYSVELSPALPFLSISQVGPGTDSFGRGWPDTLTLTPVTENEIGLYNVVIIYQ